MTKEVTTEDIMKCIDKWTGIRDGKVHVKVGCSPCQLCKKTIDIDKNCNRCPLFQNGFGCLLIGSNWGQFNDVFEFICVACHPLPDYYIKDIPVPALRQKLLFHIGVMIKHLEICLEQLQKPYVTVNAKVSGIDTTNLTPGETLCLGHDGAVISAAVTIGDETKEYVESIQDAYAKTKQHSQQFD